MGVTRIDRVARLHLLLAALWLASSMPAAQSSPPAGKMWLIEDPPLEHIEEVYGVEVTEAWLEKTRLAGLRFGGGSASFVSPNGLVLTNHHVVVPHLQQMEHEGRDLGVHGYVARTLDEELPIPGGAVIQLVHVEDVTDDVFAGVDLAGSFEEVERALAKNRRTVLADAGREHPGMSTELVTLYRGARVHLYVYRVHSDVRLAFAPEFGAGYFGGDTDNFRFPRFALDFALCRVYENGAPLDSSAFHFTWSDGDFAEGEVVFSVGNPGSTDRLLTVAELEYHRDAVFPARTAAMAGFLEALDAHADRHPSDEEQLRELAYSLGNVSKSDLGVLEGLRDEDRIQRRRAVERDLRDRLADSPELDARFGGAWDEIELATEELEGTYARWWYQAPRTGSGGWFRPLQRAMALVEELHPDFLDEDRISETPAELAYPFEVELFADHIERGREVLGDDDPAILALLAGREPAEAARALLEETRIGSTDFEQELRAGGWDTVSASEDPAIAAARVLYPLYVQNVEEKALLEGVIEHQAILVGMATDAIEGPIVCPEASFTQRLSAGIVAGYSVDGQAVPASTRFEGLFARCAQFGDEGDFDLPDQWFEKKAVIDLETPLNLVCTLDSAGGSSGSPVFDQDLRIVGVLFDGNEQGVENEYLYEEGAARSVVVHSEAILETLTAVYDAHALAEELAGSE